MEIKNYTEHPLHLYEKLQCDYDEKGKKWIVGEKEKCCATFSVVETLRAETKDEPITSERIDATTIYVPIIRRKLNNPDLPPEVEFGVVSVVSFLYISAIKSAGYSTEGLVSPEVCWGKLPNGQLGIVGFVGLIVA